METLEFDSSSSRRRYFKSLSLLALGAVTALCLFWLVSSLARQAIVDQRTTERELNIPRMRFFQAAPQFNRPFSLAVDRHFTNQRSSLYSSPALSYLDKKGISTSKLAEQYETLWRLLELLQLNRDFAFEERALHTFLTASSSEVIEALGEKSNVVVEFEGYEGYKFLSEQGLAWYLQHYYLEPATDLTFAHQYGSARRLIYDALHRLQFRTIALSRHLRIPEYDRTMLFAAIYARPEALIGRDETLQLLLKTVRDDFPRDLQFEIESHPFPDDLRPLQKHMLGIYDIRRHDYAAAIDKFTESSRSSPRGYLHDLSTFMAVRSRFWAMHESLLNRKSTLSASEAQTFSLVLEEEAQAVQAPNLRANIREYISFVKTDFTRKEGIFLTPKSDAAKTQKSRPEPRPLPPPNMVIVPPIAPLPPHSAGNSR